MPFRRFLSLAAPALFIAFVAVLLPASLFAADGAPIAIVSSATDGHLRLNGDDGWDGLRETGTTTVFDDLRYVKINTRPDVIYRGFLFFDTSGLPDDDSMYDVRLHIYAKCTGDLDDCQLYVLACPPEFPHEPLQSGDRDIPWAEMTECAHVDVGDWTELAYREIRLDDPSVLNASGSTVFCLVERRDYENIAPPDLKSENEIKLYSSEEGEGYQPYLEVAEAARQDSQSSPWLPAGRALAVGGVAGAAALGAVLLRRRRDISTS